MAQRLALIRFYFHEVPQTLDEYVMQWNQLAFALQFHGKMKVTEIKKG